MQLHGVVHAQNIIINILRKCRDSLFQTRRRYKHLAPNFQVFPIRNIFNHVGRENVPALQRVFDLHLAAADFNSHRGDNVLDTVVKNPEFLDVDEVVDLLGADQADALFGRDPEEAVLACEAGLALFEVFFKVEVVGEERVVDVLKLDAADELAVGVLGQEVAGDYGTERCDEDVF